MKNIIKLAIIILGFLLAKDSFSEDIGKKIQKEKNVHLMRLKAKELGYDVPMNLIKHIDVHEDIYPFNQKGTLILELLKGELCKDCTDVIDRGKIVAFEASGQEMRSGRVFGLPGDNIKLEKGMFFINGVKEPLKELKNLKNSTTYMASINKIKYIVSQNESKIKGIEFKEKEVPKDHYFVIGDNRTNFLNSIGPVFIKRDQIKGKEIKISMDRNFKEVLYGIRVIVQKDKEKVKK